MNKSLVTYILLLGMIHTSTVLSSEIQASQPASAQQSAINAPVPVETYTKIMGTWASTGIVGLGKAGNWVLDNPVKTLEIAGITAVVLFIASSRVRKFAIQSMFPQWMARMFGYGDDEITTKLQGLRTDLHTLYTQQERLQKQAADINTQLDHTAAQATARHDALVTQLQEINERMKKTAEEIHTIQQRVANLQSEFTSSAARTDNNFLAISTQIDRLHTDLLSAITQTRSAQAILSTQLSRGAHIVVGGASSSAAAGATRPLQPVIMQAMQPQESAGAAQSPQDERFVTEPDYS